MKTLKGVIRFFSSMRFALALLVLLAAACILGSVLPQGQSYDYYAARYSERAAMVFFVLFLDDVFHSWWFIALTALLCINLLACNLTRIKAIRAKCAADKSVLSALKGQENIRVEGVEQPELLMRTMGMRHISEERLSDGTQTLSGYRHRLGHWGAWITHLGLLILVFGFALGQMSAKQVTVAGFSGDETPLGSGNITVAIDEFTVDYNDDGTPRQYTTRLTASKGEKSESGQTSVNHPARVFGFLLSQNSYGYAAQAQISQNGEAVQTLILFPNEAARLTVRPDVSLAVNAVRLGEIEYSYYVMDGYMGGEEALRIAEDESRTLLGDLEITFSVKPYTVLVARRDVFRPVTFAGALTLLFGLFVSFYLRPVRVVALRRAQELWEVRGYARRGDEIFPDRMRRIVEKHGFSIIPVEDTEHV